MANPRMNMHALTIMTVQPESTSIEFLKMGSYVFQCLDRLQGLLPFPLRRRQKAKAIARCRHRLEVSVAQTIDAISAKLRHAGMRERPFPSHKVHRKYTQH